MDNTDLLGLGIADPGTAITDPTTGQVYVADANGNLVSSGLTDANYQYVNVQDQGSMGQGPGGGPTDTGFNLGAVATGIMNAASNIANATPQLVNSVRNARTAVAAINTPTLTQQWLQMPLQTQLIWGAGIVILVILAVRWKL